MSTTNAFNPTTEGFNLTTESNVTNKPTFRQTESQTTSFYDLTSKSPDEEITWDDATWILTSAFIIFTMQSGELLIHFHNNKYAFYKRNR